MAQPALHLCAMLGHQTLSTPGSPTGRHIFTHAPATPPDPEDHRDRRLQDPVHKNTGPQARRDSNVPHI